MAPDFDFGSSVRSGHHQTLTINKELQLAVVADTVPDKPRRGRPPGSRGTKEHRRRLAELRLAAAAATEELPLARSRVSGIRSNALTE